MTARNNGGNIAHSITKLEFASQTWVSCVGDLPAGVGSFRGVEDAIPRVGFDRMLESQIFDGRFGEGDAEEAVHLLAVDVLAQSTDASVIRLDD